MKNKSFALFALSVFVFAFLIAGVSAVNLATWDFNASSTTASATSSNTNLAASAITVGAGVVPGALVFSADGLTATTTTDGWNEATIAAAVTDNDYYQVTVTPNSGFNFVITSINFNGLATDAMDVAIRTSEDSFASSISTTPSTLVASTSTPFTASGRITIWNIG